MMQRLEIQNVLPYVFFLLQLVALLILSSARRLPGRAFFIAFVVLALGNNLAHMAFSFLVRENASHYRDALWIYQLTSLVSLIGYVCFLIGISKSISNEAPLTGGGSDTYPPGTGSSF